MLPMALGILMSATFSYLAAAIYFNVKKLSKVEHHLNKSIFIDDFKNMLGDGWWGKLCRINIIALILWTPRICHRKGLLNLEQYEKFPYYLKVQILTLGLLGLLIFISMITLNIAIWAGLE